VRYIHCSSLARQGDKRSQNADAQGTRAPTTTLYVLCGLQEGVRRYLISHDKLRVTMMDMGYRLRLIDLLAKLYRKQLAEVKVTVETQSLRHLLAAVTPSTAVLSHRHSFSRLIPAPLPLVQWSGERYDGTSTHTGPLRSKKLKDNAKNE